MSRTEFTVEYQLYDTTALADGKEDALGTNQTFADLTLIKKNQEPAAYATLEQNFFTLDGSLEEFPDSPDDLVYFSSTASGADGTFTQNPKLRINFTEHHTSTGLTLHFTDDHPQEMKIRWYDLSGIKISEKNYLVDAKDFYAENQVEEYGAVELEFIRTVPHHYVKLYYIEYGHEYIWGEDVIKSGTLQEETDMVCNQIPINKLKFDFIDVKDEFNIGNTTGLHKVFQKKQKMYPYEIIDGKKTLLGVYFLDQNSTTKNISKIEAVDFKGMLDNTDFKDGRIYNGEKAGILIEEILAAAGISDYTIDSGTYETLVYGTLKIQTCRKALREVLFACGSIVNTSRLDKMDIHKTSREVRSTVRRSRKFSTTLKTDHYVSDVNVKYKTWTLEDKVSELTKGIYGPGIHTIQLSNPAAELSASAGKIVTQMPYYVVLEVPASVRTEIVISGRKYVGEELAVLSSIEHIKSGEVRSTKTFTGTLLNYELAKQVADSILDYYQLQQVISCRFIGGDEIAGSWAEIENPVTTNGNFAAGIESLSTDLTGGFLMTAKCRGYYKLTSDYYYLGELYADDEVGIM